MVNIKVIIFSMIVHRVKLLKTWRPSWLCLMNIWPYREYAGSFTVSTSPIFWRFFLDSHSKRYMHFQHVSSTHH